MKRLSQRQQTKSFFVLKPDSLCIVLPLFLQVRCLCAFFLFGVSFVEKPIACSCSFVCQINTAGLSPRALAPFRPQKQALI